MLKYATFEGVFFIKNFKKERKIQVEKGNISSRKKQKYSNKKNLKYSNSKIGKYSNQEKENIPNIPNIPNNNVLIRKKEKIFPLQNR